MELTTKEEAIKLGLKRFYIGKQCLRGHFSPRFVADNSCCQCKKDKITEKRKSPEFRAQECKREINKRKNNAEYKLKKNKQSLQWFIEKRKDPEFVKKAKEKQKKWRQSETGKEWTKNYVANKLKNNPVFLIANRTRSRIKEIFRKNGYKKGSTTEQILGCSFDFFKKHIEMQFTKQMTWENKHLWHIDHIVPVSNAKTEEDVLKLNHFTNLRPLMAVENLKKNSKQTYLI